MSQMNPIRTLVLHHDPLVHAGLAATFRKYQDLEVLNPDGSDSVEAMSLRSVDVIVADYDHGIELATHGARRPNFAEHVKVMIVATCDREWEIRTALERGVRGYVLFGCALDELARGVREVNRGIRHLSPRIAQRLAESMSGEALTSREEEVLRLVVDGMGNKIIARRLGIAVGTVKSHLKGIFDKLQVDSRTQAIGASERRGLLAPLLAVGGPATNAKVPEREEDQVPRYRLPSVPEHRAYREHSTV